MAKAPRTPPAGGDADVSDDPTPEAATQPVTEPAVKPGMEPAIEPATEFPDVQSLSYEAARDELSAIVAQLEGGQVPLEEGMRLWRRGEALAARCTSWLDGAQRQISGSAPASAP